MDPRLAPDLQSAAQNPDGTYSLPRAMSWMSEALNPGHGVSEAVVRGAIEVALRRSANARATEKRAILPPDAPTQETGDAGT